MLTSKKSRHIAALLLTAPLIAGLTACSTADTGSAPAPRGNQTKTFDSFEEYQLAFSNCMRGKGIDMADPNNGGQSISQADDGFLEAAKACQSEIGRPPAREGDPGHGGDPADTLREEHLKIAKCLREHGVDVADPAPGEDLAIPSDVPVDAFETCAPNGVGGAATGSN
ncbi:hypothetical protein ACIBO1_20100 [Micromonospora sp. NPDC049903]|uniref:hypothetical protein n=1 Tax=Micromonospora sp. NPDC049903 TaxID=3364276 RepID=UPI0037BA2A33